MNFVNPLVAIKVFAVNNLCRALLVLHIQISFFSSFVILHRLNFKTSTTTTASTATFLRSYDYGYTWHKHYVNLYLYLYICVGFSTINKQSHWNQLRHCCHRIVELLPFFFWLIIRRLCATTTTGWRSGKQLVAAGEWEEKVRKM